MAGTLADISVRGPTAGPAEDRKILFSFTIYQPGQGFALSIAVLTLAATCLLCRNPAHLLHPQLWAEDGRVWLDEAYTNGAQSLFWPHSGYLQVSSRLTALCALFFPFTAIPLIFVIVAAAAQLLPVVLLLSRRAALLVPSLGLRLCLIAFYIAEPNSSEVYLNLTNNMWHLALAAALVLILPKPRTDAGAIFDVLVLVLSGISGPFILCLLPIAWWQTLRAGGGDPKMFRLALIYAAIASLCAGVQGLCVLSNGSQRLGHLGPSFSRLVHIIANQIVLGGVIGAANVSQFCQLPVWQSALRPALICGSALCIAALALKYGPVAYRQFMLFCGLLMAAALSSPVVSASNQWYFMQYPGIGDRYYVLPMLAWFLTIVVVAQWLSRRFNQSWPYFLLLSPFLIGILADWHYLDLPATGYYDAAERFDAASPGTEVTFAANPLAPVWKFTLTKKQPLF